MSGKEKPAVTNNEIVPFDTSWTPQVLVIGAVIGALTGLGAAYLLIQRSKRREVPPNLSASEGLRLGLLVFGLLRQVATLGDDDQK